MTKPTQPIQALINRSKEVIADCALENGAIVAANTDKEYTPREAGNYRAVWPRDAAFVCIAAKYLNLEIQEPYFKWLYARPEDFKKEKRLFANYSTNGRIGSMGHAFQPDQMGSTLWAIHYYYQDDLKNAHSLQDLIELLANGLAEAWNKTYFTPNTVDIWEESTRKTSTQVENNFTYSLAACARGLLCANEIFPNNFWKETAMQMLKEIDEAYHPKEGYIFRNQGKISDPNIDASLLGLAWPFKIYEVDDERIVKTVAMIEEKLVKNGGVHRFQHDYYDGEGTAWEGGGSWPLLNFWMSIYWSLRQDKKKALQYYNWVIERLDKYHGYIPEQIFDDFRQGIYPLSWAHSFFIIASKHLGYL
ncbi:MAG: glycoside hydrolase family 15 protein [Patescibacteria group bacterium]